MSSLTTNPFATAGEMLAALQSGEVSAADLTDICLERIARYNPALNAVILEHPDEARASARATDEARARGETAPLLGLPVTIKDSIDVRGYPTVCGVDKRADIDDAEQDAPVVARLRAAGAVILGKTNTPQYTDDWQTVNTVFGRTANPWNTERTPGGSSGGAAVAVAVGFSAVDIGSDIGGSIRVPAAFCGVYGHRPSDSIIPRSGHFPGRPHPNPALALNVVGPLARSPEDLELILEVTAGPDVGDDIAWTLTLPPPRYERLADFRVAVLPPLDLAPIDAEIRAGRDRVVEALRTAGASVHEASPSVDWEDYMSVYETLLAVMTARDMSPEDRRRAAAEDRGRGNSPFAHATGWEADAYTFLDLHDRREQYRAVWRGFFREWDILLAPITQRPAWRDYTSAQVERYLDIDGQQTPYENFIAYPAVATLPGHPATAFPVGLGASGLPIGLQAIGPYLEDRTTIRFAALLAQEIGGYTPPPGYQ